MSEKHTPGPWFFDGSPDNIIVWSDENRRVCFMTSNGPTEANARLIVAAPDLARKLSDVADHLEGMLDSGLGNDTTRMHYRETRQLLAKATGL